MKRSVTIVEDEINIRNSLHHALSKEGYSVNSFESGKEAWRSFDEETPDVAVLDITVPGMDGLELCRKLRERSEEIGIIFVSSRDEELDRILGLEMGADDYLCKPFSLRELMTRIKVLLRRSARPAPGHDAAERPKLVVRDLTLDLERFRAEWKGRQVDLTVTEFMLLHTLALRPGHVKSREQLRQGAYRYDHWISDRTIDSHVKRLRKKLREVDLGFDEIETVYGMGYRWRETERVSSER